MQTMDIELSSGNVYADVGLPNPEERLLKSDLSIAIEARIEALGITQALAAEITGLAQTDISKIIGGKLKGYGVGRLLEALLALGNNIRIAIEPLSAGDVGKITVDILALRQDCPALSRELAKTQPPVS